MRFVIDAQLTPALAKMLVAQGYEAVHVRDLGMRDAEDTEIWNYALEHNGIIITKDGDFKKRFRQVN